jgi:hypothetical protein
MIVSMATPTASAQTRRALAKTLTSPSPVPARSNALRSTADVCSTRIPGGAGNNHCTKSCELDPCQPNPCTGGTCVRNGVSFSCSCPIGTQMSGNTCINLCAGVNCGAPGSSCFNGVCTCPPGYQQSANKNSCVDRCNVAGAVPCSGPMSMCSGGTCSCGGGNILRSGGVCESSTECNSTSFVCIGGQCGLNETNQRVCRCPAGMKLDNTNKCVDIDECKDGTDECIGPATCVNQFGATYTCSCDDFNRKQGTFLVLKNQFECGQPCQKNCNGVGTCSDGTCTCQTGFVADPTVGCRAQCPNDCSGSGTCTETGSCVCNDPAAQAIDCSDSKLPQTTSQMTNQSETQTANDQRGDAGDERSPSADNTKTGLIAGIAVGAVVIVVLVIGGLFAFHRRAKKDAPTSTNAQPQTTTTTTSTSIATETEPALTLEQYGNFPTVTSNSHSHYTHFSDREVSGRFA